VERQTARTSLSACVVYYDRFCLHFHDGRRNQNNQCVWSPLKNWRLPLLTQLRVWGSAVSSPNGVLCGWSFATSDFHNNCAKAKSYLNWFIYVRVIARQSGDIFGTWCTHHAFHDVHLIGLQSRFRIVCMHDDCYWKPVNQIEIWNNSYSCVKTIGPIRNIGNECFIWH